MCRVQFSYSTRTWSEVGAYGSITKITNMPRELAADDNIIARDWEGRLAGNDDNNSNPGFVENGYITGIAAFQGRLVLLSGRILFTALHSYAGILELIPSPYTAAQYTTQDATVHLPRYIPGRVLQMQNSSVTNMAFSRSLLVYEFMWGGSDGAKMQAAWHKWSFPYPILSVQALEDEVFLYIQGPSPSNKLLIVSMDPREGYQLGSEYREAYSDLQKQVQVQDGVFTVPAVLRPVKVGVGRPLQGRAYLNVPTQQPGRTSYGLCAAYLMALM